MKAIDQTDSVCLPLISNRNYTSQWAHAGFMTSATLSGIFIFSSIFSFFIASQKPEDSEVSINAGVGFGITGAALATSALSFFFCGTKRNIEAENQPLLNDKKLLQQQV